MCLTMARPSPVPPRSRERLLSTRKNRSVRRGMSEGGMPIPSSTTARRGGRPLHPAAGLVVLDRVLDGVGDNLADALAVADHEGKAGGELDAQLDLALQRPPLQRLDGLLHEAPQVERLHRHLELARL